MPTIDKPTATEHRPELGSNLRQLRLDRNWSLSRLAAESGLPQSTLSKVENGQMSLNYDKLLTVADALQIDIRYLFMRAGEIAAAQGSLARRTLDRADARTFGQSDHYRYQYLCTELKNRLMAPLLLEVGASTDQAGEAIPMMNIIGERFAFVLEGPVEFVCEQYENVILETGDSLYVDAGMPHAFVARPGQTAKVLTVLSSNDADYLRLVREAATRGESDASEKLKQRRRQGRAN